MSSEPTSVLVNLHYRDIYVRHLAGRLPEGWTGFAGFFGNLGRLTTLGALLERHLPSRGLTVLNVGCGPFASEIFLRPLQGQQIVSFDYTTQFMPFFPIFRKDGYLSNTLFLRADAHTIGFCARSFDLIIVHDVLYEPALDFEDLVGRLGPWLKPSGHLYFDVMDERLRPLWRVLGRERAYRRYRLPDVEAILARHGFSHVAKLPTHAAVQGVTHLFHAALWRGLKLSNAVAYLVRKDP